MASSPIRNGADDDYEDIYQRIGNKDDDHKPCLDPDSRAILYPLDNFKWNENNFQRPLALKSTTRRLNSGKYALCVPNLLCTRIYAKEKKLFPEIEFYMHGWFTF